MCLRVDMFTGSHSSKWQKVNAFVKFALRKGVITQRIGTRLQQQEAGWERRESSPVRLVVVFGRDRIEDLMQVRQFLLGQQSSCFGQVVDMGERTHVRGPFCQAFGAFPAERILAMTKKKKKEDNQRHTMSDFH